MNHIGYQTAKDNSTINNAEQINYNIFDAPLKFYCDKKVQERPELKPVFQVLQFMVNKDNLRQRLAERIINMMNWPALSAIAQAAGMNSVRIFWMTAINRLFSVSRQSSVISG